MPDTPTPQTSDSEARASAPETSSSNSPTPGASASRTISPFKDRDFRNWFIAETLLTVSMSMQLAMSLVLIDVSHSLSLAGFLASAISAVQLVGGVTGGALADHVARKALIQRCVLSGMAAILVLLALLAGYYTHLYAASTWLVVLIAATAMIVAGCEALADPSMDAALKEMITPEQYPRAASAAEARAAVVSLASRPATGALYSVTPLLPFVLRLIFDSTFLALLRRIKRNFDPAETREVGSRPRALKIVASYRGGLRHVFSDPVIRTVTLCAPLVNLMVFTGTSWAVYDMRGSGQSALVVGLVTAGFSVGSLIGSAVAPALTDRVPSGWLAALGLSWMAAMLLVIFLLGSHVAVLFVAAVACMIPSPSIGGALFAHVFDRTPSRIQGRTLGIFTLFNGFATILAPTLAATAVDHHASGVLGWSVAALGVLGILGLLLTPQVRRLPALRAM